MHPDSHRSLKVANILEEARFGGPHKRVVLIAEAMDRVQGPGSVRTTVICPSDAARFIAACNAASIPVVSRPLTSLSRNPKLLRRYLSGFHSEVRQLRAELRRLQPDLVHCSGGPAAIKSFLAAHREGLPAVWHMNDASQPRPIRAILRLLSKSLRPDGVAYSGDRARNYYQDFFASSIPQAILRPPIDAGLTTLDADDVAAPVPTPAGVQSILLVGNINPTKNTLGAVQSVVRLLDEGERVKLVLVGETKQSQKRYLEECQSAAGLYWENEIKYVGPAADVSPYFLHCDVALCNSVSESGPMTAWEAIALGSTLCSTDVGDVRKLLSEVSCVIFEPADVSDTCDAIREALLLSRTAPITESERNYMVTVVGSTRVAAATIALYNQVADAR